MLQLKLHHIVIIHLEPLPAPTTIIIHIMSILDMFPNMKHNAFQSVPHELSENVLCSQLLQTHFITVWKSIKMHDQYPWRRMQLNLVQKLRRLTLLALVVAYLLHLFFPQRHPVRYRVNELLLVLVNYVVALLALQLTGYLWLKCAVELVQQNPLFMLTQLLLDHLKHLWQVLLSVLLSLAYCKKLRPLPFYVIHWNVISVLIWKLLEKIFHFLYQSVSGRVFDFFEDSAQLICSEEGLHYWNNVTFFFMEINYVLPGFTCLCSLWMVFWGRIWVFASFVLWFTRLQHPKISQSFSPCRDPAIIQQ